jgi:putative FmdB family regulatory protein
MPTYSYYCLKCKKHFELFSFIKDYKEKPSCINCKSSETERSYISDVVTQMTSVRKSDSELKTIGDLAKRNSDKLSEDEKTHLYHKHNSYKYEESNKELPSGMSRIKKPKKTKWPGTTATNKRKPKK